MSRLDTEQQALIKSVLRYNKLFNGALIVIHMDDALLSSPLCSEHIKDIAMLHEAGLKIILVPGSRRHIDAMLTREQIPWRIVNSVRIADERAMPLIKMAAFEVSNELMAGLAQARQTAVIGNWVRSRGRGIENGLDYITAGEIDKIYIESVQAMLKDNVIPIFPCIGWSLAGKPYNISSMQLASEIAVKLRAKKLLFLTDEPPLSSQLYRIPPCVMTDNEGKIDTMSVSEAESLLEANPDIQNREGLFLCSLAVEVCAQGVERVHILSIKDGGSLLSEIFSDQGAGTLVYGHTYGSLRAMTLADIPAVLSLMRPFVESRVLIPRSQEELFENYKDFTVFEFDGDIRACASLHIYEDGQAEIAAVAVDPGFSHMGIGPSLIRHLLARAEAAGSTSVFVLTTKTADWFEQQGFVPDSIDTMPAKRREKWSSTRRSKLLRRALPRCTAPL